MRYIYMYGDLTVTNDEVSISRERYDELIKAESWVDSLEAAGVDNWDGYEFAREIYDAFNKK